MISQIDVLLCRWGRWAVSQARKEVGFPSVCPTFRDASSGRGYGSEIPFGVSGACDMEVVDRCVGSLPIVLRIIVIHHYQRQGSIRSTAVDCGISHKSASQYLSQAHQKISELMDANRKAA